LKKLPYTKLGENLKLETEEHKCAFVIFKSSNSVDVLKFYASVKFCVTCVFTMTLESGQISDAAISRILFEF